MNRAKTPEEFKAAEKIFQELSGYEDADEQAKKCAEKMRMLQKMICFKNIVVPLLRWNARTI